MAEPETISLYLPGIPGICVEETCEDPATEFLYIDGVPQFRACTPHAEKWYRIRQQSIHARGSTIHRCPPEGSGIMPCCGRTPFEVRRDRLTLDDDNVTCQGAK